ncbi:MAG: Stp1/IreP family PP2C-type Ser/Thr phosphatase [Gemmatimonadota bacterium]|jgi:protein phosphatase|nr:Stp1/IreP family PP2C-type Ser/Thr phosphatase [Gemmatimonadota bacterium]
MIRWEVAATSDVGRVRPHNEDAFRVDPERGLFLIADGMGGHAAGEVASRLAIDTVYEALVDTVEGSASDEEVVAALVEAFAAAYRAIFDRCAEDPRCRGMGTTLIACVGGRDGHFHVGHIGDSRAYLLRDGALEQLTHDHTWVQREIDAGRLSRARARRHPLSNVITRALGADGAEPPDLLRVRLVPGDALLLATDGLTGMVDDPQIAQILGGDPPLPLRVRQLVDAANEGGGTDNITAVLVQLLAAGGA